MAEKVTAFVVDTARTGSDAPVEFGVIPGTYSGEPVSPSAFGFTLEQMRTAVREFNLPLREVKVAEKDVKARLAGPVPHWPSEAEARTVQTDDPDRAVKPSHAYRETATGPIPAAAPGGVHPPLLPGAAAMIAFNTALGEGSLDDAAKAAREYGEHGEGYARSAEAVRDAMLHDRELDYQTGVFTNETLRGGDGAEAPGVEQGAASPDSEEANPD